MVQKYIDVSATNNGDGTTSAQAGAPGGVGAWNTIRELDGTPAFGSAPSAGDTVNVRTADGGGNLSETLSSNLTLPANTSDTPIEVLFDDGTVWAQAGVMTLVSTGEFDFIVLEGWWLHSTDGTKRFNRWSNSTTARPIGMITLSHGSILEDTIMDSDYIGTSIAGIIVRTGATNRLGVAVFRNCTFDVTRAESNGYLQASGDGAKVDLINCIFDCTAQVAGGYTNAILELTGAGNFRQRVYGGGLTGEDSTIRLYDSHSPSEEFNCIEFYNFFSGSAKIAEDALFTDDHSGYIRMEGTDGEFNFLEHTSAGYSQAGWSGNGNHPTLNATLPDGSDTPWTLKCWADQSRCTTRNPHTVLATQKIYNAAAATKTVRLEMIIHDSLTSPQKDEWYIDVWFTKDSDSSQGYVTSRTSGALATSTVTWNPDPPVYGGNNYTEYKIELSTGVDIKQYTPIMVNLYTIRPAGATTEFYFVDPDFQLD